MLILTLFQFWFNWPIFPDLHQVRPGNFTAKWLSSCPDNSTKAQKRYTVVNFAGSVCFE